jgi:hypothetical protein
MNHLLNYISYYAAPLVGIIIGLTTLSFIGYMNWYGEIKAKCINWLAEKFFRNNPNKKVDADSIFMTITSYLLAIGGLCILISILFLSNSK